MEIHESWNLAMAKLQLVRFAVQTAPNVSKMLIQFVHWTCNTGETEMLMRFEIFMAAKPYFVIFWVMTAHYTVGGYKCCGEPWCPHLQDRNISNLKTEAAGSCTTLITTLQSTKCHNPDNQTWNFSLQYKHWIPTEEVAPSNKDSPLDHSNLKMKAPLSTKMVVYLFTTW
jgi:hypothetical protein